MAAVITVLCAETSTLAKAGASREEVGDEELSLFMLVALAEGSISDIGEIRELLLERNYIRVFFLRGLLKELFYFLVRVQYAAGDGYLCYLRKMLSRGRRSSEESKNVIYKIAPKYCRRRRRWSRKDGGSLESILDVSSFDTKLEHGL